MKVAAGIHFVQVVHAKNLQCEILHVVDDPGFECFDTVNTRKAQSIEIVSVNQLGSIINCRKWRPSGMGVPHNVEYFIHVKWEYNKLPAWF